MHHRLLLLAFFFRISLLQAQVFVHEEPRHRPVFETDRLRILNVLLPPGDTTQYHIHHTPSLFLFFTSTTTGSQLQGAAPSTGRSTAGTLLFENLAPPHRRVHRVWNVDADTFHVMDIELLSTDTGFRQKPLLLPHLQLTVDTPWVRVYRMTLEPGKSFSVQEAQRSFVLVSVETTAAEREQAGREMRLTAQPGSFFPVEKGQRFALKNTGSRAARFALLELP